MSGTIAVLSSQVADQIAAGEVVERPASVVKELVENALDAGARAIRVDIEDGGKSLIRVSDDGEGMTPADAALALSRHATSKIREAADLIGVGTFGFRGEALPAIASVSRFELETSADGATGARLRVVGGRLEGTEPAVRRRGTSVTVRGLFFNTPARRKFLRATSTEVRAAGEALTVLALARPDVAFAFASDGKSIFDVPVAARAIDRVHALWGRGLADTLLPLSHREGPVQVTGFAQRPSQAKPAGRKAYVFVRGRPIKDPFLVRAAEAGYRSAIHPGDRPSLVLFLDLPGDAVDVNVHPAKLEVRFRDKYFVEKVVEESVRAALAPLAAAAPLGDGADAAPWTGLGEELPGGAPLELFAPGPGPTDARRPTPPLLQVFDTYILFQTGEGVAIVDQHSAHERVLYESVMRQLSGDGAPAQRLLLPLTLEFAPAELDAIDKHRELLARVGFEVAPFSGRTVVIHTAPNPHPRFEAARCFQELVADLAGGRFGGWQNRLERFAATFACRAAIKAGHHLDPEEMRELLYRLLTAQLPAHDVHGRPTIVQLPQDELERRFGRSDRPLTPVLVGPTGVGKTAVAIALAARVPLTVISADARQIYRGLDIGTAKPAPELRARVPHLGIDLVGPGDRYSAGRFARDAAGWLAEVRGAGRLPLVVGGTGLYIRALADGLFQEPPLDPSRRDRLRAWAERLEGGELSRWAGRLDRDYAGGGSQRAARAIEVALLTGRPLSWWQRAARETGVMRPWYIHLTLPRESLQRRIYARVDEMLARGLIDEVRGVLAAGVAPAAPGLDAVGYREVVAHLGGRLPAAELRAAIVIATRQYAKRQRTWFRHQLGTRTSDVSSQTYEVWTLDATESPETLAASIADRWRGAV